MIRDKLLFPFAPRLDSHFIAYRVINHDIVFRGPEVEQFQTSLFQFRHSSERVAMPHEEPELAVHRINLDARLLLAAIVRLKPIVQVPVIRPMSAADGDLKVALRSTGFLLPNYSND